MTAAREAILARLERFRPPPADAPAPMAMPPMPIDSKAMLRDRIGEAGGSLQVANRSDWPDQIAWPAALDRFEHIYSARPEVAPRGVGLSAETSHDLHPLDVCVLSGDFAVVENGAVWQTPLHPLERPAALLATHLILVVEAAELVPTLHQAYERIATAQASASPPNPFGWFLCGPSKTADIEQSLVLGAHGPRTMSLVLVADRTAPTRDPE